MRLDLRALFLLAVVVAFLACLACVACFAAFYVAMGKEEITPDVAGRRVYLAGYGDKGRRATGVRDALYARGVLVSDGQRTAALVAVDLIGLFRGDVEAIRRTLGVDPDKQAVWVAATHTHSGPDTLGLWGPYLGVSGVDDAYQQFIRDRVARLVKRLAGSLQQAAMFSAVRPIEMKGRCKDLRDPVVMDPDLAVIQFRSLRDKSIVGTMINWSCHPEILGAGNSRVSADFPGALCAEVEKNTRAPCLYLSGSIGGMQSPDKEALTAGGKSEGEAVEALGHILAQEVERLLRQAERSVPERIAFSSAEVRLTIENSKYLLFLPSLAFGHVVYGAEGNPLSRWGLWRLSAKHSLFRLKAREFPQVETEVARLTLGPVEMLGIPGEIFPELVIGGYDGRYAFVYPVTSPVNPDPPKLEAAPSGPYLKDLMRGRHKIVIGLANDEIGYILPAYDFKTTPTLLMRPHPAGHHYEETNSIGKDAAERILSAARDLLAR